MILKANGIAHLFSQFHVHLLADSLCHAHSCYSPGLGAADLAPLVEACLVEILRDLGGLSAACFSDDDEHVVVYAGLH